MTDEERVALLERQVVILRDIVLDLAYRSNAKFTDYDIMHKALGGRRYIDRSKWDPDAFAPREEVQP